VFTILGAENWFDAGSGASATRGSVEICAFSIAGGLYNNNTKPILLLITYKNVKNELHQII
jgi:hypothetical protein